MMQSPQQDALRVLVNKGSLQIKIEVSPVSRGTLHPVLSMDVRESVEDLLGFASIAVESVPDLYGGKICAALDRQHPRDLFDIKLLLEAEELTQDVFEGFMAYLISHPRPMSELLAPNLKPLQPVFDNEFAGMTTQPISVSDLTESRFLLLSKLKSFMTPKEAEFLISIKKGEPDWSLYSYQAIQDLPAVKWKLYNIKKMPERKHTQALKKLSSVLDDWLD